MPEVPGNSKQYIVYDTKYIIRNIYWYLQKEESVSDSISAIFHYKYTIRSTQTSLQKSNTNKRVRLSFNMHA
jgi:hypothetical protein